MLVWLVTSAFALEQAAPLDQLADFSDAIVIAEVVDEQARWSTRHPGDVETVVWLATEQVLLGEAPDLLEVLVEGGQIGAVRTGVSGQPELLAGHRYQLYLVHDFDGNARVIGPSGALQLAPIGPLPWTSNGNDWSWEPNPVSEGFELNKDSFPDPAGTEAAWLLSLAIWNGEGQARVYLPDLGRTDSLQYGELDDGHNVTMYTPVTFDAALAQSRYRSIGDEMIDCDTEFYGANTFGPKDWSTAEEGAPEGAYDFAHTSIHELGHCLGFSHSVDGGAIMQSTNTDGTGWERRHLGDDDIAGLQAMYGAGAVALQVIDVAADGAAPGQTLDVAVTVRNAGDAPSVDVQGVLTATGATVVTGASEIGDVLPGASRGTAADTLVFSIQIASDCSGDADLQIAVDDWLGNTAAASHTLDLDCAGAGDPSAPVGTEEPAVGCGCSTSRSGFVAWWLPLLLWVRRPR